MASVARDPGGRKRILFFAGDGKRRTIRLGKVEMRHAESVRAKVEALRSAATTRQPPDNETSEWLLKLDDDLYEKLAAAGLVKSRQARALEAWLANFMESRDGLKPESRRKLEQTAAKLTGYFTGARPLSDISADDAALWRADLKAKGLSEAAVKTHTGNAKTIFAEAVRRGLIPRSPFMHLKGGVTPTRNTRYVTPEETEKILEACPDAGFRLLVGLARLAGLRTPSETHLLTWDCVDWSRARLRVRSPKTERYSGHEQRIVPIGPRLMQLLQASFDEAEEGETRLITFGGGGAHRRKMRAIMDRAGVEPWDDTWQTLRRSCEIEWAQRFPQYAVSKWIGHSIAVSGRHYANAIPDELFERAAGEQAAQIAAQHAAELPRTALKPQLSGVAASGCNPRVCQDLRDSSMPRENQEEWSRGESNPRAKTAGVTPLRVYPIV